MRGDVPPGARWGGTPAKPVRLWFRELTLLRQLAERKDLKLDQGEGGGGRVAVNPPSEGAGPHERERGTVEARDGGDRRYHEASAASLSLSPGRSHRRHGRRSLCDRHQERHRQRAVLPGAFPRQSRHARRAPDRRHGADRRRAVHALPRGVQGAAARLFHGDRQGPLPPPRRSGRYRPLSRSEDAQPRTRLALPRAGPGRRQRRRRSRGQRRDRRERSRASMANIHATAAGRSKRETWDGCRDRPLLLSSDPMSSLATASSFIPMP